MNTQRNNWRRQRGFTLLELIVTLALLALVVGAAVPVARNQIKRQREKELRYNLRQIRMAIDDFHNKCPRFNKLETECFDAPPLGFCYPKSIKCLVDGVPDAANKDLIHRFLRKLLRDPMTNSFEWKEIGVSGDDKDSGIFDVKSNSSEKALDGTSYQSW